MGEVMAQFIVRNLEGGVKERLKRRAKRHGHSMEEEVRDILRSAVHEEETPGVGLGTEIASIFSRHGLTDEIPELKRHSIEPPEL
jgi:antitoxin FitA